MPDWLVPPRQQILTPNRTRAGHDAAWKVQPVEAVVLHFTTGYGGEGSARYLANLLTDAKGQPIQAKASAHFVVGRSGEIWQLMPLSDRAWHAGSATWRSKAANSCTIGIELANLGPLFRKGSGWVDWWGKAYHGAVEPNPHPLLTEQEVTVSAPAWLRSTLIRRWCKHAGIETPAVLAGEQVAFDGLAFEPYQPEQLRTAEWLVGALADLFPRLRLRDERPGELSRICGHEEIDPARKLDPGPAFPLQALRDRVQG